MEDVRPHRIFEVPRGFATFSLRHANKSNQIVSMDGLAVRSLNNAKKLAFGRLTG
jgi:hypothetical protein